MNVQEALLFIDKKFEDLSFIVNKKQEAKWILSYVLNIPVDKLILYSKSLEKKQIELLNTCIEKRATNFPLDYIFQNTYFWKYKFIVSEDTLIPRLDTETIIKAVLENYSNNDQHLTILDIGTGTGCIIITLLKEYLNAQGVATDISNKALEVAKTNAKALNVASRVTFLNENIIKSKFKFDIIVSNPPYIDNNDTEIDFSVKNYEPQIALFAKNNGLEVYEKIFKILHKVLNKDGKLFLEIGHKQKQAIINIANKYNFNNTKTYHDTGKKERVLVFSYK